MSLIAYFPLAYGLLTGKYRRGEQAPAGSRLGADNQAHRLANADWDRIEALRDVRRRARSRHPRRRRSAGWRRMPTVGSVIAGATRPEQVEANVRAGLWQPTAEDLDALAEVNADRGAGMTHASFTRR